MAARPQAAAASYGGDFCAEDIYESWASSFRDELLTLHLSVLRALSVAAREADERDLAVQSMLSLRRHDPYDESTYLALVGLLQQAGRYGDARRHYRRYVERMVELNLTPQEFP